MEIDRDKIRSFRKKNKLTVTQVALYIGKSRNTVTNWEQGKSIPEKTDIFALAHLFGISMKDISNYENLPSLGKENITKQKEQQSVIEEIDNIIKKHGNIPDVSIKPLKIILNENRRLVSTNRSLSKTNMRLKSVISSINEIIYIKDGNRILRNVNDRFLDLLQAGLTSEDVIGSKAIDIFGRREIEDIVILENEVFETGKSIADHQVKIPGSFGKKQGLISIEPILDENDEVIEIAVSIKDISDIVENAERLNLLERIINSLDVCVWIEIPYSDKYEFLSKGIEKITGLKPEEIINDPTKGRSIILDEDFEKFKVDKLTGYLDHGTYQFRIKHKDGSLRWIENTIYRDYYKGKVINYGINEDITKEKEAENINQLLKRSLDGICDAVFLKNKKNTKYLFVNKAVEKLYGYSRKIFYDDCNFWFEKCLHEDDKKNELKYRKKEKWPVKHNVRIKDSKGKVKWIEERVFTWGNYFLIMEKDVTNRYYDELRLSFLSSALNKAKVGVYAFDKTKWTSKPYKYIPHARGKRYNFLFLNKGAVNIYGYPIEKLMGDKGLEFWLNECIHPKDRETEEKYWVDSSWPKKRSFRIIRSDGKIRTVESHIYEGEEDYSFVVETDVTDLLTEKNKNKL
ncbi:MAG TPA: PAS domain S-box protein [Victivallales bacterium]|nr:PAS domain S-box protein [Victivallales bacterium]